MRGCISIALLSACSFAGHGKADDTGDDQPAIDATPTDAADPWLPAYTARRAITIHGSQIDAALANFPVAIDLATLESTDVAFTTSDGTTRLDHEIDARTAWVKLPALAPAVDTTIFVYAAPLASTPPSSSATAVWSEGFGAVYHFQQDPGAGDQVLDSTALARHAKAIAMDGADHIDARIGSGLHFNGSDTCVLTPSIDLGATFTVSMWTHMDGIDKIRTIFANSDDGSSTDGIRVFFNTNQTSDRRVLVETGNGNNSDIAQTPNDAIVAGTWQHVAVIVDRAVGNATIVVDGAIANAADVSIRNDFETTNTIEIGRMKTNNPFAGLIDEVEIASTARTVEWLRASYRNQSAPTDFYTIGAVETR